MAVTLKVQKWHTRNVCVNLGKGLIWQVLLKLQTSRYNGQIIFWLKPHSYTPLCLTSHFVCVQMRFTWWAKMCQAVLMLPHFTQLFFFCLPSTRIARCNCWNYYDSNAKSLGIALTTYHTKIKNWNSANLKLFLAAICHLFDYNIIHSKYNSDQKLHWPSTYLR